MRLFRLLPFIGLISLGLLILGGPGLAQANLSSLYASTPTPAVNQQVTISANLTNIAAGTIVTMTATNGMFTAGTASGGETVNGGGTMTLSFTAATTTVNSSLLGAWTCLAAGSTTFTVVQNPAPLLGQTSMTTTVACTPLATTPPTQASSLTSAVNGTCNAIGQLLVATGKGAFTTQPPPTNMTIASPSTASCLTPGIFTISYSCTLDGPVTFNMLTNPATLQCSGTANPYTPTNQFCPLYNAVAPYGGGVAFPGTAPYTGSPFPFGYNGALNQTTGLPYAYGFAPTAPGNPSAPFNGVTYPPNYSSVIPYTGLTYPNGYNPLGSTPGIPGNLGGYPSGIPGQPYAYNGYSGYTPALPNGAPVGTGTNYCPPNPPADVAVRASSPSVACAGTSQLEVLVRDGAGLPVANGQKVTLSTTYGTVNPATVSTIDGKVTSTFWAPKTGSGTANITVTAVSISNGDVTTSTSVNVECTASAVATPTPAYAMPYSPVMMPPNTGQGNGFTPIIRPPSTGDAGLAVACLLDE